MSADIKPKENQACIVCGSTEDFMVAFTTHKVCGKCTRKAHRKVLGK
jgi:hypothetical protein